MQDLKAEEKKRKKKKKSFFICCHPVPLALNPRAAAAVGKGRELILADRTRLPPAGLGSRHGRLAAKGKQARNRLCIFHGNSLNFLFFSFSILRLRTLIYCSQVEEKLRALCWGRERLSRHNEILLHIHAPVLIISL